MSRNRADQILKTNGGLMTRAATPEQIVSQAGERTLVRQGEVRNIDEKSRTVELAFSSEAEVERWFGMEVLDHSPGAMRTERLENAAALLVDHNWRDQVGVVESISIGADRRGRAVVRFGKGARASEIWQDVVDRIRQHVSVGYRIHAVKLVEERENGVDVYRMTDWEPYEISIVSVPADPTVGVGRSQELPPVDGQGQRQNNGGHDDKDPLSKKSARNRVMNEKKVYDQAGNYVRALVDEEGNIVRVLEVLRAVSAEPPATPEVDGGQRGGAQPKGEGDDGKAKLKTEQERVNTILELGEKYEKLGSRELAAQFIRDGKGVNEFQKALLAKVDERANKPLGEETEADLGMSDKEVRRFSFMRAFRALANPNDRRAQEAAAFEFECSRAAEKLTERTAQGIIVPADVLRTPVLPKDGSRVLNTSTSGTGAGDTGGYAIATDLLSQSFIELLRNRAVAMRLGMPMGGLVGNLDIPKQIAGATGYWVGEDEDTTETGIELDQISMTPKTVGAFSEITRKMLQQSSMDVEALTRRDLAIALALTIDKAMLYGSGTANQPLGIINTSGINSIDFAGASSGGDSAYPTYGEFVDMETEIAADNADVNSMAYLFNSRMRGHCKKTQRFAGTDGSPIWEQGGTVNGYRTEITNQVADIDVLFGNFADLLIGMWGGLDLTVDPYSNSKKGRLRLVVFQDVDCVVRREESFCYGSDAS